MANMPILGSQTLPYGILPTPNVNLARNVRVSIPYSSGPPNTTKVKNARPIFQNMPRTLPLGTPNNTVKSLVIFR